MRVAEPWLWMRPDFFPSVKVQALAKRSNLFSRRVIFSAAWLSVVSSDFGLPSEITRKKAASRLRVSIDMAKISGTGSSLVGMFDSGTRGKSKSSNERRGSEKN